MEFLNSLWDMLSVIFIQIGNVLNGIVTLITVSISALTVPSSLFAWVPGIIGTSVMVVTSISVVKLILGWGNQ